MTIEQETVGEVFSEAIEAQAFMFADEEPLEDLAPPAGGSVKLTMEFSGPHNGQLLLVIPRTMCTELTVNILGIEEEEIDETIDIADAAKELLNVVCGQLLTAAYGQEPVFDLSVPLAAELDEAGWQEQVNGFEGLSYLIDDYPALLSVSVKD